MKPLLLFISLSVLSGCTSSPNDATAAELEVAAQAGREAARKALTFPKGSMQREDAIIAVRARETLLRQHGFESCADTFAASARQILLED